MCVHHEAQFFVRQNFSIVPHVWLPEKVTTNCLSCALYGTCGQHAMLLALREMPRYAATPSTPAPTARCRRVIGTDL